MTTWTFKFNNTPRTCQICGKKFTPKSPVQKYCGRLECQRIVEAGVRARQRRKDATR
jgi:hypothetical protein